MSDKSAIEWTEATWNPVTGCTKVSPGCAHCYIERTPAFRMAGRKFVRGATDVRLHPERLATPLKWREPHVVFVNSLSDLFHDDVPDEFIDQVFAVMALTPQHTYQVLTKRPERMRAYITDQNRPVVINGKRTPRDVSTETYVTWNAQRLIDEGKYRLSYSYPSNGDLNDCSPDDDGGLPWPLKNVWLGVTVENQRFARERIPVLLDTPAAVRFLSCEPLLGPLNLYPFYLPIYAHTNGKSCCSTGVGYHRRNEREKSPLDWVIVGGESGGPAERRLVDGPFDIEGHPRYLPKPSSQGWVTSLRDQCVAAGVPFFFKQWGGPRPKSGGRMLDGREWSEMPARAGG